MSGLAFTGGGDFRTRIVFSLISEQPVKITKIHIKSDTPGLSPSESSFLQLVDQMTNGSIIKINQTGTMVHFTPGTLIGGTFSFTAHPSRGLGYYLEPLLLLAPFSKSPSSISIHGVTNNTVDPSPEMISLAWCPLITRFMGPAASEALQVKVEKRGAHPEGGGTLLFSCRPVIQLKPVQFKAPGKIYRIRGYAWTAKVSPQMVQRMIYSAKSILMTFINDIYINAEHFKAEAGGLSPGFGITLVAETKEGARYSAECMSEPSGSDRATLPEDVGLKAASLICEQIYQGGCMDVGSQSLLFSMMALVGGKDVSQILSGPLSQHTINTLRLLKTFFQVTFHLKPERHGDDESSRTKGGGGLMCTCVGAGIVNMHKTIR